jgi:hypothetical protein
MRIKIINQSYLICLSIGITLKMISLTAFALQTSWVISVCNSALLVLCIFQLLRTFYLLQKKTKWLLIWCIGATLLFIGYRVAGDRTILEAYAYGTGAIFIDYDKIISKMRTTWTCCTVTIAGLSLLGVIPTTSGIRETGAIRTSLGFVHPNTLGFILFIIGLLFFLDSYQRRNRSSFIILLMLTTVDYFIANSRTTTVLLIILDIMTASKALKVHFITHHLKKRWGKNFLLVLICSLVIFTLWFATTYDGSGELYQLNEILNDRVQNGAYYMSLFGISLFGKDIPDFVLWSDNFTHLYLDNGYLLMLIKYGVIASFIYLGIILQSARKAIKNRDIAVMVAVAVIAISLFTEQSALQWELCPVLMYMNANNKRMDAL